MLESFCKLGIYCNMDTLKGKLLKIIRIWFIIGAFYFVLEGIWRIPQGGYANIIMLPIGGLCGVLIGGINQVPRFYRLKVLWQTLLGTVIVLIVEFIAGFILNIRLGLDLWDYSQLPFNVMGQVAPRYAVFWFFLIPFGIWFEDKIRYDLWREGERYSLLRLYKDLFTFK